MKRNLAMFAILSFVAALAQGQEIGEEKQENLFELSVSHDWDGPPACNPHSGGDSRQWEPRSGWVIISEKAVSKSSNNGRTTFDRVSGGPSFPGMEAVSNQFDLLLAIARATKNDDASREISNLRTKWLRAREGVTRANRLNASVWAGAHGNCFDRKGGWESSSFSATTRYVGDEQALTNAIATLKSKYFPNI